MTDATLELRPVENSRGTANPVYVGAESVSLSGATRTVPFFVPREQLYYWTKKWQAGEVEAVRELKAGLGKTFPDGASAARWLLSDED